MLYWGLPQGQTLARKPSITKTHQCTLRALTPPLRLTGRSKMADSSTTDLKVSAPAAVASSNDTSAAASGKDAGNASNASKPVAASDFTSPSPVFTVDVTQYPSQLDHKLNKLKQLFANFNLPEVEVFESSPINYRMRADFEAWGTKADPPDVHYIMYDTASGVKPPPR